MKHTKCPKCGGEGQIFADEYYCPRCRIHYSASEFGGEYLGGHSMYAYKRSITLSLCPDEVRIPELDLQIPYSAIKEVKNINGSNLSAIRVLAIGLVGALLTRKETYLCLVYNDGKQDQNPVFRLDKLEVAQKAIYQRVVQARKAEYDSPPPSRAQRIASEDTNVKEIIKETRVIVKVRCPYCKNLYEETLDKCPHCGARQT